MKPYLLFLILIILCFYKLNGVEHVVNTPRIDFTDEAAIVNLIQKNCEIASPELLKLGCQLDNIDSSKNVTKGYRDFAKAQGEYSFQNYQKASSFFRLALEHFRTSNDSIILRSIYNQLGNINYILRDDKKAFEYYMQAFELSKKMNRKIWIANTFNNLGLVCHHQRDFKQAEFYYSSAVDIYNEIGDIKSIADVNYNRAMTYSLAKNNEMAEKYTQLSLSTYTELNDIEGIANSTYFLGQISEDRNQLDISDQYYLKSLKLFETIKDSVNQMPCLMKIAHSAIRNNNYKEAQKHIDLFKHINSRINDIEGDKEILKLEYLLNKKLGNYQLALTKHEALDIVKDSMIILADAQKFAELRVSFAQDIQELELAQLKENSRLHKIILISIVFSILLLLITLYLVWRSHRLKEERKVLMLEHKVLRTQMDPHFVFNTMSALQFYILEGKPEIAINYINDFSSLLRRVLQYSKSELVPIAAEKDILEHYFALQNRRFNNKINFSVKVEELLLNRDVMIPPMLAQPFIENSIKHAELDKIEDASIQVRLSKANNFIKLTIEDNGIGIEKSLLKHHEVSTHKSMAISITHDRLKLFNINQKDKIDLQITDLSRIGKRGTLVEFMIPIDVSPN